MEVQSTTPHTARPKRLSRTFVRVESAPVEGRSGRFTLTLQGAWCGLVAGLLGLVLMLTQQAWTGAVRLDFLTLNRHVHWMMPATDGLLFTLLGAVLGLVAGRFPKYGPRGALCLLAFLTTLEVLSTIEGMHAAARLILAAGLASCAARASGAGSRTFDVGVRRTLPVLVVLAVCGGVVGEYRLMTAEPRALAALPAAPRGAPNVLLVVLDTVRADRLSLYGYPRNTTPNLDKLARGGLRFDQARSPAPYTMPSHASMFTGRWPHELNDVQYAPLDESYPTLAEHLRDRGYRTGGFVGNTYYCNEWFGLGRGFAHYEDYPDRREVTPTEMLRSVRVGRALLAGAGRVGLADAQGLDRRVTAADVNRRALDWLDHQAVGAPFFLFLNYIDAHAPYFPPADYTRRFSDVGKTVHAYTRLAGTQRKKLSENTPEDRENRAIAAGLLGDAYDDCIGYLDEQLARLLGELDRRGLLDNTLVVVTSDHGDHLGEHELFGHGTSLYQALVHVPLVIVPPKSQRQKDGAASGQVIHEPVSLRALPATVLDMLKLEPGTGPFPGRSLAFAGDAGTSEAGPEPVLSELDLKNHSRSTQPGQWHSPAAYGPMQALAGDGFVYIHNGDDREELYDLEHDPGEQNDLAGNAQFLSAIERFRRTLQGVTIPK